MGWNTAKDVVKLLKQILDKLEDRPRKRKLAAKKGISLKAAWKKIG